jgi:hypothetical protein
MPRTSSLLVASVLLGIGSIGVSAEPRSASIVGEPQSMIDRVQYDNGVRCFNQCVYGSIFQNCQTAPEGKTQNCCSEACTRLNNQSYREP